MFRFDKLTVKAQESLRAAQELAARHSHQEIQPLHLLAALIDQREGIVHPLLARSRRASISWWMPSGALGRWCSSALARR